MMTRERCVMCFSTSLQSVLEINNFPIHMGTTEEPSNKDLHEDQIWSICTNCGCLQLKKLLPLKILYSSAHNEVVGLTWQKHHNQFSNFIARSKPMRILEIGASHGYLSTLMLDKFSLKYTIIEPTNQNYSKNVKYIKGFIENNLSEIDKHDCIVHSHVLEHVYEPVNFILKIFEHMKIGTNMFISFPNIERLIELGGANALNFEHTYYLHPRQFETLINLLGIRIVEKKNFELHSYFYWLKKETKINKVVLKNLSLPKIFSESKRWLDYRQNLNVYVEKLNSILQRTKTPTFLFGAHIFSQSLIAAGLNESRLQGILDNSTLKSGQRLYGTKSKVMKPEVVVPYDKVQIILKASHYQEEIKKQLKKLNRRVIILE